MSDVNIIQNIPSQKLFHINNYISHNPLWKSVNLCSHTRMHLMDKDMVDSLNECAMHCAHVTEKCDTCHLLLQYLSMNSSLNVDSPRLGWGGRWPGPPLSSESGLRRQSESGERSERAWQCDKETMTRDTNWALCSHGLGWWVLGANKCVLIAFMQRNIN